MFSKLYMGPHIPWSQWGHVKNIEKISAFGMSIIDILLTVSFAFTHTDKWTK